MGLVCGREKAGFGLCITLGGDRSSVRPASTPMRNASVDRFAAQLDRISIRVSEPELELLARKLKRPVDHRTIPQEAALEHEGLAILPASLVRDERVGGDLAARAAIEPDRLGQDRLLPVSLGIDRELEGRSDPGKVQPDRPDEQLIVAEPPGLS